MEIYVVGKQWMWKVQHQTGQREINELHVPVGTQRQADDDDRGCSSRFFDPGISDQSRTSCPAATHILWFEATKPGKYQLFCAEYCGLNHSGMGGWVYVMEQRDFDNWLSGNVSGQTPVEAGQRSL